MALRPAVQALKDFGPLDYEPETDERIDPILEVLAVLDTLIPTLTDEEVEVVVRAMGPLDDDFYGAKLALIDDIERTPGWPQNVLKLDLPDEGICWPLLMHRARYLPWRTEYIKRATTLYACKGLEVRLRLGGLHVNTKKSTRLSTGASPWIKTFPAGLLSASAQG